MIDFAQLIQLPYLLEARPAAQSSLVLGLASLSAAGLVASPIVWYIFSRASRTNPPIGAVGSRLSRLLFTLALVGLFLVFFRWQGVPYLGSRIWLLIWLLIGIVWLVTFLVYLLKKFPHERRIFEEERRYARYLPKARAQKRG